MTEFAVGLMAGTSADGVSLALCSFSGRNFKVLNYKTYAYPAALTQKILGAYQLRTPGLSQLNSELGVYFADKTLDFIKGTNISPKKISVIGSHGQTVYHGPADKFPNTLQIGEPSFIAEKTGIPVAADFRPRDIAAGGEGAPLIPFFDHFFFGQGPAQALQNIGGISNVTILEKGKRPIAFDNGPGNCLIDWAISKITKGKKSYDKNGLIAKRGFIHQESIKQMANHPYFSKKPPKSTGRELFNANFIPQSLLKKDAETLIATLTFFTAYSIHESFLRFIRTPIKRVIVSGGGALNSTLMNHLKQLFAPVKVASLQDLGLHPQAKEAAAFAFFGLQTLKRKINHLPEGTGARGPRILGKLIF